MASTNDENSPVKGTFNKCSSSETEKEKTNLKHLRLNYNPPEKVRVPSPMGDLDQSEREKIIQRGRERITALENTENQTLSQTFHDNTQANNQIYEDALLKDMERKKEIEQEQWKKEEIAKTNAQRAAELKKQKAKEILIEQEVDAEKQRIRIKQNAEKVEMEKRDQEQGQAALEDQKREEILQRGRERIAAFEKANNKSLSQDFSDKSQDKDEDISW